MKRTIVICECDRCHKVIEDEPMKVRVLQGQKEVGFIMKTLSEKDLCMDCVAELLEFVSPDQKKAKKKETPVMKKKPSLPIKEKEVSLEEFTESLTKKKPGRPKLTEEQKRMTTTEKRTLDLYKHNTPCPIIAKTLGISDDEVDRIIEKYVSPDLV